MLIGKRAVLAFSPALVGLYVPAQASAAFGPAHGPETIADWRLAVAADPFSGERRCRVWARRGAVAYSRGTIVIRLPRVFNPSEAMIHVDDGVPIRWRDLVPEIARLDPGFASDRDGRRMLVPAELLKGRRLVAVSADFGKRPRAYRIAGLYEVVERAAALGCRPIASVG
ncbi:hypothetical protein [Sphingomonas xinjiangensis]|uniref:Uncharacterized protein n=1 Tax=Sphingomonas xinjiangensis TaxID=643568 RepID=A0A840YSS7_9SPHN|nr:hypothetical protein [Sphingomonas xinjiangensis]MBB5712712.1 hypothetical protein [Sphingomonas xinjiangensis]